MVINSFNGFNYITVILTILSCSFELTSVTPLGFVRDIHEKNEISISYDFLMNVQGDFCGDGKQNSS